MINIKLIAKEENRHLSDCERIVKVMNDNGYNCSIEQAKWLWEKHSDSMAAGWMNMTSDSDTYIFDSIRSYFEPDGQDEDDEEFKKE